MGARRDVEQIVKQLRRNHGCTAELRKNGHWRVHRKGRQSITTAGSPSDRRATQRIRSDVRRYLGVELA